MTLTVTHPFVSSKPQGGDSTRIYGPQWNANHTLTGTADASQLNANVVQSVVNDTNIQGTVNNQVLTFSWGGTLAAARLNANVVQAVTNDTNIQGTISAQNLTFSWSGLLGLARGGTNADLSATGGAANYLKQVSIGAAVTVGTIPASDIASGAALTKTDDTNVTLTLGGTPASALLKASSITVGWTGTLAASRGGFGADVSAAAGVPLFAAGVPTFTSTSGSGNFVRVTSPTLVTPALGTPSSGTLTNCTGLPLTGLASQAAWTFLVNNTSGSAAPTAQDIHSLTVKASPASTDEVIIWDIAGSALKKATVSGIGASAGVSSIAGNTGAFTLGTGLTNATNDIRVSLSTVSAALGADVNISNSVYTDGPSIAQGTSGTWLVIAKVNFTDTAGACQVKFKLWDGTTIVDSADDHVTATSSFFSCTLAGVISSPAANLKVSALTNAAGSTTTQFRFNASGNSKDCSITAIRIA